MIGLIIGLNNRMKFNENPGKLTPACSNKNKIRWTSARQEKSVLAAAYAKTQLNKSQHHDAAAKQNKTECIARLH